MKFFCGLHHPGDAKYLDRAFISVNALRGRKSDIHAKGEWIMDSGAFTTVARFGGFPEPTEQYAAEVRRWSRSPGFLCGVAQDYMCEPEILGRTGLTIEQHQLLTILRYRELRAAVEAPLLPVLQGYRPADYVRHVREYGPLLPFGAWVGVGTLCKRNGDPSAIVEVLQAIKRERPDLRLHGFGLKKTALQIATITDSLYSADSAAWSYAARKQGRDRHCWREAKRFAHNIESMPQQTEFAL